MIFDNGGLCSHAGYCTARPWHGHPFDPISGKALADDPDLQVYEVETREDGVYVKVEAPDRSPWTVSHVMAETMVNRGITHAFGMVGHSNLGLAEAPRVRAEKNRLNFIGVRHEGVAAYAVPATQRCREDPPRV